MDKKRLHQVVDAVAAKCGGDTAISQGAEKRSYQALTERTRRIAGALTTAGLQPQDVVLLFLRPDLAYVEALLAVLKAGGVFCPVSPGFPDARTEQILAEARPAFCVSDTSGLARLRSLLPEGFRPKGELLLEGGAFSLNGLKEADFPVQQDPDTGTGDDPAYLIATSGSTGKPKLILGVHKSLSHFIHWEGRTFCGGMRPCVGFLTPSTFDVSLRDIFLPLHIGGRLCISEPGLVQHPAKLVEFLLHEQITHLHVVPSVFRLLLAELESRKSDVPFFKNLKTILFAGEPLYGRDLARWRALGCSEAELVNLYGPTETTLAKLCHRIGDAVYQNREIVPLGHPIENSAVMIVKGSRLCRPGEIGEIWIRTPFMSHGYYGRPDLTEKVFLQNPFSETPEIAYRTGDMGRYREDGTVAYAGRKDRQLKVNGIRVEPEEIEAVLLKVPGVSQALVLPYQDPGGELRTVAYLTPISAPGDEELWDACKRALPAGMSPSFFVRLDAFPLNFNGKVDAARLPHPDFDGRAGEDEGPQNDTEAGVADIFKEILGITSVPMERKFTAMGGNSLAVIRLTAALFRRYSLEMPLADFYAVQTVRGVADWIRNAARPVDQDTRRKSMPPLMRSAADSGPWPLSSAQRRMWVLDRMDGGGAACHVPSCLRVEGPLDKKALEAALLDLIKRHEALHTIFPQQGGGPVQSLAEPEFTLEYRNLSGLLPEADKEERLDALLSQACRRPFDLESGPLFRGMLICQEKDVHLLFLDFHHIICDGGSMDALTRELGTLYRSHRQGREAQLPEIEFRYRDYTLWQQDYLTSEAASSDREYWQAQMAGAPAAFTLPFRRKAPARPRYAGKSLRFTLDTPAMESLRSAAREADATDFVLFTAITKLLLFRYTGQKDGVVGAPVTERPHPGLLETAGFFVNTLPLRDCLEATMTFPSLLRSVARTAAEAMAHAGYPFDRMVEDTGAERSSTRNPLFQIMVVAHENSKIEDVFDGCRTAIRPFDPGFSRYDVAFTLEKGTDGWVLELVYNTDLFDEAAMARMAVHFQTLVQSLGRDPEQTLATCSLIPPKEMHRMAQFSAGPRPTAGPVSMGAAFFEAAVRFSGRPALKTDESTVTYGELLKNALALAGGLRHSGLEPGGRVAVYLPRGEEQVTAMLGIFLAGGVYMPFDPVHVPEARARELIDDSGARLAIGDGVPGFLRTPNLIESKPIAGPAERSAEDAAYLIFTSGSTGIPKPVVLAHGGFLSMLRDQAAAFGISETDCITHFLSPGFDAGLFEVCLALFHGAGLCIVSSHDMGDPGRFQEKIRKGGATVLNTTPSWLAALEKPDPGTVRLIISGGEPPRMEEIRHYLGLGLSWANCYGPTEASVCTAFRLYRPADGVDGVSLGRPVAGMKIRILDDNGNVLPPGVPGEVVLSGPGVAIEISGEPPAVGEDGGRLYHTGDRGRWNSAGELLFEGRMDEALKLRGFRIHPEEIRQALLALPGVRDVAVGLRNKILTAWIVGPGGGESFRLRRSLGLRLPAYMIPSAFVTVPGIPLSPNGKADIASLPDPPVQDEAGTSRGIFTPEEAALARIWEAVLGAPPAGPDADFFASGGNSLSAVRFAARIRQVCGADMPVADLFREPRLSAIAANYRELRFAPLTVPVQVGDGAAGRLSDAERRMWAMEHLQSGGASAYTIHGAWRVDGPLDVEALKLAVNALVARHPMLRTVYREDGKGPARKILPPASGRLRVETDGGPPDDRIPVVAAEERGRAMDLENGPLFRARLLVFGPRVHGLVLTLHHIVADGWSMGILERDLRELYTAFSRGLSPCLPPLDLDYGDAAAWMEKRLENESDPDRDYWLTRFSTLPEPLDLPSDRPRPAVQSFSGACHRLSLGQEGIKAMRQLATETGCTPFMVLFGLVNLLLYRHSGARDIVLGCPTAGRSHPLFEDVVGCFVNTLPLRTELAPELSLRDFMDRIRAAVLEDLTHGDFPFDRLVELLPLKRDTSRPPLFNVMMTLADVAADLPWDDLQFTEMQGDPGYSKCDLTFSFMECNGELVLDLEYATALFGEDRIGRMARRFGVLLADGAGRPDATLSALGLMDAAEAAEVATWSEQEPSGAADAGSVLDLFFRQANLRPEAPALVWDEQRVSYGELEEKSRALAARLLRRGLKKKESVAILARPVGDMVTAVLAVCRAGGVYVPLDPAWPVERRQMILSDTDCRFILADPADLTAPEEGSGIRMLSWDENALDPEAPVAPDCDRLPDADDLAYIMYTSGSTGKPKGVEVPHRAILRLVSENNFLQPEPGWRILQAGALAFDASTYEVWGALANGAALVLAGSANLADPAELTSLIRSHAVSTLFMTTSYFNQMADAPYDVFTGVRHLLTGGERASLPHIQKVRRRWPDLRLVHVYGPTENTTFSTFHPVDDPSGNDLPLGKPIRGGGVAVLDQNGRPVPPGVPGEICLYGDGLARGYRNRPEENAARFIVHPGGKSRMYRTGDLGTFDFKGRLCFLGRMDRQVKVRGFRVEPDEVAACLSGHPRVRQCLVLGRALTGGPLELIAFFTGEPDTDGENLRAYLGTRLPGFMIPSFFVRLDAFPLNRSGKIDRNRLPDPRQTGERETEQGEMPRDTREKLLAGIWEDVLGQKGIGRQDNFFTLGGDSIKAIAIMARLRETGWTLSVRDLFAAPEIALLAPAMRSVAESEDDTIPPGGMTPVQRWFFAKYSDTPAPFHQSLVLRLKKGYTRAHLETALAALWQCHEMLRSTFPVEKGKRVRRVQPADTPPSLTVVDLSSYEDPDAASRRAMARMEESASVEDGPLWQPVVYRTPGDDILHLCAHHLLTDGISWRILMEDLQRAWDLAESGETVVLAPPATSASAWCRCLSGLKTRIPDSEKRFWEEMEGMEVFFPLPSDTPVPPQSGTFGDLDSRHLQLEVDFSRDLTGRCHEAFRTRTDELLLTGLLIALSRWRGCSVHKLSVESHGRETGEEGPDLSRTVGWLTAIFPLTFRLPESLDLHESVRTVKTLLRDVPRRGLGYGLLRWDADEDAGAGDNGIAELAEIGFNYMGEIGGEVCGRFSLLPDNDLPAAAPEAPLMHALSVSALMNENGLALTFAWDRRRFYRQNMEELMAGWRTALAEIRKAADNAEADLSVADIDYDGFDQAGLDALMKRLEN